MKRGIHRREGSSLLIVFWALLMLTGVVFVWADWIQHDYMLHAEANRQVEARAMAYSGLQIALHPKVTRLTPLLRQEMGENRGYEVTMVSEGGKLNLRWWMEGEDPRKMDILKRWMEQHGLSFQEREVLMDSMLDYVDADSLKRLNGQEVNPAYTPANRPFENVDDLAEVFGSEPLMQSPGWRDDLTIYSQGPLDLTSAPAHLLRLIPGFDEPRIEALMKLRQGMDGEENTVDDLQVFEQYKTVDQLLTQLNFSQPQQQSIAGLVMIKDQTMNILSRGRSGKVIRQIEVVAVKTRGNPVIRVWNE